MHRHRVCPDRCEGFSTIFFSVSYGCFSAPRFARFHLTRNLFWLHCPRLELTYKYKKPVLTSVLTTDGTWPKESHVTRGKQYSHVMHTWENNAHTCTQTPVKWGLHNYTLWLWRSRHESTLCSLYWRKSLRKRQLSLGLKFTALTPHWSESLDQ